MDRAKKKKSGLELSVFSFLLRLIGVFFLSPKTILTTRI